MNFKKYYQKNKTFITFTDVRLEKIIELITDLNPKNILDIGCGDGYLLKKIGAVLPQTKMSGIDVYKNNKIGSNIKYKVADITEGIPFKDNSFDCVVLGEVIEHIPNPDFLLKEIRRVLRRNGTFIISTPNLVSWANRFMVMFGIQPFFTETSSEIHLGRKFKILGQGREVQGHLKIFTSTSLEEILIKEKFKKINKYGVPFFFPFPISLIDSFFTKFISLSSGLLYTVKK